ncbi:hypothetical protein GCM10023187_46070 [Nibrella viscosa]|uniref:Uncharacterized protein n=2 Tax=Nibrella viscosa TaxID=1084524 RepID=A0ABP8KTN2_9BACT
MEPDDEFYVGYFPIAPGRYLRFSKRLAGLLLVGVLFLPAVLVLEQKRFATSTYEYGNLTELEGIITPLPVPTLKWVAGNDANGKPIYQSALLVNNLKFGADPVVASFAEKLGRPLAQTVVKIRGTLIYHDGITVLELTEGEKALLGVNEAKTSDNARTVQPVPADFGEVTLRGEIVDPKCYFGAMKPGQSKPHRSCAIRCISGGIPPVLAEQTAEGSTRYYLLTDENGNAIHREVLDYVAEPVQLKGRLTRRDDWYVLSFNPATGIERLSE